MTEALKHDKQKVRMELLSVPALNAIAEVLTFGAAKYSPNNWRQGFDWSRLYGAALRHITAHMAGEDRDPESGLSHLAHAGCCLMFLLEHEICKLGTDDRYIIGKSEEPKVSESNVDSIRDSWTTQRLADGSEISWRTK